MNWRWWIGRNVNSAVHLVLSRAWFPLTRYIPPGHYWHFDFLRFRGGRTVEIVFDVGANVGQTLCGFVQYFPNSRIHCFEPVSSSFQELITRFGGRFEVAFNQVALGSADEIRPMSLHANSELNTFVNEQPRTSDLTGAVENITMTSLDRYCSDKGIHRIDLLKLDVQGWELEVLRGGTALLDRRGIHFIFAEVGFRREDSDMQHFAPLNEFLESQGFQLCGFYDSFHWGPRKSYLGFSNALYVHPDFKPDSGSGSVNNEMDH